MRKTVLIIGLVALLGATPLMAQNFSSYVTLGDSITAGFMNAGLAQSGQEASYASLLAQAAGAGSWELPLISNPGMPGMYSLQSLATGSPEFYIPSQAEWGMPLNATLERPYNNLAVPGADLNDMILTTGDITRVKTGTATPDTLMFDLILRNNTNSALELATALQPTFITMWIGNNDALPAALTATAAPGFTLTLIDEFEQNYNNSLAFLTTVTSADIVVFTIPEGAILPFATTLPPVVVNPATSEPVLIDGQPVPLIGSNGPVAMDSFITLGAAPLLAQGFGIPVELGGNGMPLPDDADFLAGTPGVIIRADEMALIQQYIRAYNDIIYDAAATYGARVFDVRPIYASYMTTGVTYGAITLTGSFLTGGIFSYDGLHQNEMGHGDLAVNLIDFLNDEFGGDIPQINMADVMHTSTCSPCGSMATLTASAIDVYTAEARRSMLKIMARKFVRDTPEPGASSSPGPRRRGPVRTQPRVNSKSVIN